MGDKEVIVVVELVRILLNSAFTLAEMAKLDQQQVEELFNETYTKLKTLDPNNLPDLEDN